MIIYIGTPATIRPEVHEHSFKSYVPLLQNMISVVKPTKIVWVVNVDIQKSILREKHENKVEHINWLLKTTQKIITESVCELGIVDFKFILNRDGSFLRAMQNITRDCCKTMKQGDLFFHLEDDWYVGNRGYTHNFAAICKFIAQQKEAYELGVSSIGSFSPFICNMEFMQYYNKLYAKHKKNPEKISRNNIIRSLVCRDFTLSVYNLGFDPANKDENVFVSDKIHLQDFKYTRKFIKDVCIKENIPYKKDIGVDGYITTHNYVNLYDTELYKPTEINYVRYSPIFFRDIGRERNFKRFIKNKN